MRLIIITLVTLISAALLAAPSSAQSKRELAEADAALDQRLGSLEQRFLTGDPAAERLMQRMDALESSQRAMTGEVEQLRYERDLLTTEVEALTNKVSALRADLDKRAAANAAPSVQTYAPAPQAAESLPFEIQPYEAAPYVSEPYISEPDTSQPYESAPVQGTMGSSVVDMAELQNIGQQKLMSGDFTGAQLAFKQYVELNPEAADAGDAYFWLAETYFVKSGYSDAADSYIASMRAAPDGDKAPNAMIGLAASLRNMGNTEGACQTLAGFDAQFPSAPTDIQDKADIERQRAGCV